MLYRHRHSQASAVVASAVLRVLVWSGLSLSRRGRLLSSLALSPALFLSLSLYIYVYYTYTYCMCAMCNIYTRIDPLRGTTIKYT